MNRKLASTAAAIGFGALAFSAIGAENTFALSGSISINNDDDGVYIDDYDPYDWTGANGTIHYNSARNILTLNNFHGDNIRLNDIERLTIELKGENSLTMVTYGSWWDIAQGIIGPATDVTFIGDGKLTITPEEVSNRDAAAGIQTKSVTIESGEFDLNVPAGSCLSAVNSWDPNVINGTITINDGVLNLNSCNRALYANDVIINGGEITSSRELDGHNFTMNDGVLNVDLGDLYGYPIHFGGAIEFNGGETSLKGGLIGIYRDNQNAPGHVTVNDGTVDIDAEKGIVCAKTLDGESYVQFSGGTTNIKAKFLAVESYYDHETETNVQLNDNMRTVPGDITVAMKRLDYNGAWQDYFYQLVHPDGTLATNITVTDEAAPEPEPEVDPVPDTAPKVPETGNNTNLEFSLVMILPIIPALFVGFLAIKHFKRSGLIK